VVPAGYRHDVATMTPELAQKFLMEGTRTGKLATIRVDGRPHVVPIWFVLDGEDVVFTTGADTVKGRALVRDPRVALSVDDQAPPYSFVMVEGVAAISEEPAELVHWATRIGARYMGEDRAAEFGARNGVPGELLVRIRPTRIIAHAGDTD
jgi:PPOX class probable F420-dependent enzyme